MGTKARPFYRIVVAKSSAGRDGAFVEIIGTYNPVNKPALMDVKKDRALHWLLTGAQPTDTVAHILQKNGVLDDFFAQRPNAKKTFKSLDKRTAAISKKTVVDPVPEAPKAAAPAPVVEAPAPVVEAPVEEAPVVAEEAPAVVAEVTEEAPVEAPAEEPQA